MESLLFNLQDAGFDLNAVQLDVKSVMLAWKTIQFGLKSIPFDCKYVEFYAEMLYMLLAKEVHTTNLHMQKPSDRLECMLTFYSLRFPV